MMKNTFAIIIFDQLMHHNCTMAPPSRPDMREDRSGAGSLVIDSKKMFAIKHWMELTCDGARTQVQIALWGNPFQYGPWGEPLSVLNHYS